MARSNIILPIAVPNRIQKYIQNLPNEIFIKHNTLTLYLIWSGNQQTLTSGLATVGRRGKTKKRWRWKTKKKEKGKIKKRKEKDNKEEMEDMVWDFIFFIVMWHASWTEESVVCMEVPCSLIHYRLSHCSYTPNRSVWNKSLYCHDHSGVHSDINTLSVFNITTNTTKSTCLAPHLHGAMLKHKSNQPLKHSGTFYTTYILH